MRRRRSRWWPVGGKLGKVSVEAFGGGEILNGGEERGEAPNDF